MSEPSSPGFDLQLPDGSLSGGTIVFGDAREQERFREALKRRGGRSAIKLAASDEPDTEGHTAIRSTSVVITLDDDDTEGHAFAIHFPTREQADDLRRRLLLAGALTGTIALSGIGVAALNSGNVNTVPEAGAVPQAAAQAGPMDAHEAPAFDTAAQADAAWTDRLNAQAAAAQTGPMDAHEAPAFDTAARADAAWTERLNAQAAAGQTGPMDVHEAPAFQTPAARADAAWTERLNAQAAASQTGPMDVHEAPAFQTSAAADEDDASVTGRPEGRGPLRE